ncbi:uncharacterized protein LOC122812296 isoform X3 [Protopterus annectens]|uniref:uncharacterized protein LOC122812296 isoform X3 n=1 Tax=Protopterus annectens TaxID=7888 RepID=UPI001CFB86B4|nr:uncharacterized protein LOC122812296 isoform X3 [Protopterus annectens]
MKLNKCIGFKMFYYFCVFSHLFLLMTLCILTATYGLTIFQTSSVTGSEGGTVIMNCRLSEESLGPVRWYKGDNQQQLLYSDIRNNKSDPRVMRALQDNATRNIDFSIKFTNITRDDAGTYYCVKLNSDKATVNASGSGTKLYFSTPQDKAVTIGVICGFLVAFLLAAVMFLYYQKRKKGTTVNQKGSASSYPAVQFEQDQKNENITYATVMLNEGISQPGNTAHTDAKEHTQDNFKQEQENVTYADIKTIK